MRKLVIRSGDIFGTWTIIKEVEPGKYNRSFLVKCKCGFEATRSLTSIRDKRKHCRPCSECRKKEKENSNESAKNKVLYTYMSEIYTKKRNLNSSLTKEDILILMNMNCYYCNKKPINSNICKVGAGKPFYYNGLDRLDNNKGYHIGNVAPCCSVCNWMKKNFGEDEFILHIRQIYKFQTEKIINSGHSGMIDFWIGDKV